MSCDRIAQVHAFHDGELTDAQARASLEAHLASCEPCAELLAELRSLTRLLAEVPLPSEADAAPMSRYYGAFHKAQGQRQRGVLRLSGWMTTAAAVVIAVTLLRTPPPPQETVGTPTASVASLPIWQQFAVTPPAEQQEGDPSDLLYAAQYMADDLAVGGK